MNTYIEVTPKVSLQLGIDDVAGLLAVKEQAGVFGSIVSNPSGVSLLSCFSSLTPRPSTASRRSCFYHHPVAGLQGDAPGRFHCYLLLGHT